MKVVEVTPQEMKIQVAVTVVEKKEKEEPKKEEPKKEEPKKEEPKSPKSPKSPKAAEADVPERPLSPKQKVQTWLESVSLNEELI